MSNNCNTRYAKMHYGNTDYFYDSGLKRYWRSQSSDTNIFINYNYGGSCHGGCGCKSLGFWGGFGLGLGQMALGFANSLCGWLGFGGFGNFGASWGNNAWNNGVNTSTTTSTTNTKTTKETKDTKFEDKDNPKIAEQDAIIKKEDVTEAELKDALEKLAQIKKDLKDDYKDDKVVEELAIANLENLANKKLKNLQTQADPATTGTGNAGNAAGATGTGNTGAATGTGNANAATGAGAAANLSAADKAKLEKLGVTKFFKINGKDAINLPEGIMAEELREIAKIANVNNLIVAVAYNDKAEEDTWIAGKISDIQDTDDGQLLYTIDCAGTGEFGYKYTVERDGEGNHTIDLHRDSEAQCKADGKWHKAQTDYKYIDGMLVKSGETVVSAWRYNHLLAS